MPEAEPVLHPWAETQTLLGAQPWHTGRPGALWALAGSLPALLTLAAVGRLLLGKPHPEPGREASPPAASLQRPLLTELDLQPLQSPQEGREWD